MFDVSNDYFRSVEIVHYSHLGGIILHISHIPSTINGFAKEETQFDFLLEMEDSGEITIPPSVDALRYRIKDWWELAKQKSTNPNGLTAQFMPMYFVNRFFLEQSNKGWNRFVYVGIEESFYEILDGIWYDVDLIVVKSLISKVSVDYFGLTSPRLTEDCFRQLKTFYPISELNQNRDVVPFLDCCLSRPDLFHQKITILEIDPADQVVEHIPHPTKTIFKTLLIREECFTLDSILLLFPHLPFVKMLSHFIPWDLQQMILGLIADLIDVAIPHQWLFLFQSRHGGTGKGTIATILEQIVGDKYWIKTSERMMRNAFAESFLRHKKLFVIPETTKDAFRGDVLPLIKSYSGGDKATANIKGVKKPVNFIVRGIFYISTNDTPALPPTEKAIFRRMVLIQMLNETPIPLVEYLEFLRLIEEELPILIAFCSLLIPFKAELHKRYKCNHDAEETYDEISENPEWDFMDQFITQGEPTDLIHVHEVFDHFKDFLTVIGRDQSITTIKGFGKMLGSYIRKNKFNSRKTRKMVKGDRDYIYYGIKLDIEQVAVLETQIIANSLQDQGFLQ